MDWVKNPTPRGVCCYLELCFECLWLCTLLFGGILCCCYFIRRVSPILCASFSLTIEGIWFKNWTNNNKKTPKPKPPNLTLIVWSSIPAKVEKQKVVCQMDLFAWESIETCYHFSMVVFLTGTSNKFSGLASDVWQQQLIFIIHGATFLLLKKAFVWSRVFWNLFINLSLLLEYLDNVSSKNPDNYEWVKQSLCLFCLFS